MGTAGQRRDGRTPERLLFATAIFASAFLVFLVQPMVGKRILPWFGGAPAVWSLCLAFYQTTLFCGYAYAHGLIRLASPRGQLGVHAALVAVACAMLPVLPGATWRPVGVERPASDILLMLIAHVALPFLALAATGPLVQAWWARRHPERSPYPLYAVSNAGSLLALVAYPFVLEPRVPLSATGTAWATAFALTGALVLACAALAARSRADSTADADTSTSFPREPIGAGRVAAWLLLAGTAVVVLMGVTSKVTLDVASVPFLWVLPLGTYLLTFIVCFSSARAYRRSVFAALAALAFVATAGVPAWRDLAGLAPDDVFLSATFQIPAWCALLFGVCMVLHGELYRLRPAPGRLTVFYLCVAGGGALGGLAAGLGAPWLFDDYYELPLGLALAAVLSLAVCAADPGSALYHAGRSRWRFAAVAGVAIVLLALAGRTAATGWDGLVHRERSFFGVLRVTEREAEPTGRRSLTSGSTVHGSQLLGEQARHVPTAYYGRATAIGLWLAQHARAPARRVGVVGLGVGTLATYGRAGDRFRFYEIDPAVARIARDEGRFSFLRESRATVEVVLGDGRLALIDEQRHGDGGPRFDLLVLDAFTSDAIPVHLLTREAFAVYAAALAPEGVLAAHVSNRHFDLMPLIARQGFEAGLSSLFVESAHAPAFHSHRAQWVLLVRDADALLHMETALRRRARAMGLPRSHLAITRPLRDEVASLPVWTDDYSDLLGLLRPK